MTEKSIYLLNRKYQTKHIFLFGSYAKGTYHEDRDTDLALVFKSINDIIDIQTDMMKMPRADDLMTGPHPFSHIDFQVSDPVVFEILKNGIELEIKQKTVCL